jgi:hypothetical protein
MGAACSGFTEQAPPDGPIGTDGPTGISDAIQDLEEHLDSTSKDATSKDATTKDATTGADASDKLATGHCCGKSEDCVGNSCLNFGGGPYYCSEPCTKDPDTCPIGLFCGMGLFCVPPNSSYECGPQVANAGKQPFSGCCAKPEDCQDGECISTGQGAYFCSKPCTTNPDNCPAGYSCHAVLGCAPGGDSTFTWN